MFFPVYGPIYPVYGPFYGPQVLIYRQPVPVFAPGPFGPVFLGYR